MIQIKVGKFKLLTKFCLIWLEKNMHMFVKVLKEATEVVLLWSQKVIKYPIALVAISVQVALVGTIALSYYKIIHG